MKKAIAVSLACILLLGLCACGQKQEAIGEAVQETEAPAALTWQEQYDLGIRYLSEGNYQEAIIAFSAAIEIDPKRAELYEALADAYIGIGDTDKAQEALEKGYTATGETYLYERLDLMRNALYFNEPDPITGVEDINISELITHEQVTVEGVPFWGMSFETIFSAIWRDRNWDGYVREEDPTYQYALSDHMYSREDGSISLMEYNGAVSVQYGRSGTYFVDGVEVPKSVHYGVVTGVNGITLGEDKATVLTKLGLSYAASDYLSQYKGVVVFCDLYGAGIVIDDSLEEQHLIAMEFVPGTGGSVERLRVEFWFEDNALYHVHYYTY